MKKALLITGVVAQLVSIVAFAAVIVMYWNRFKKYYKIVKKLMNKFVALFSKKKTAIEIA